LVAVRSGNIAELDRYRFEALVIYNKAFCGRERLAADAWDAAPGAGKGVKASRKVAKGKRRTKKKPR